MNINELAKTATELNPTEDAFERRVREESFNAGYKTGYQKAREDLLSQVSEGFEKWWKSDCHKSMDGKDAWQAAKLSSLKEIEKLKSEIVELEKDKARLEYLETRKNMINLHQLHVCLYRGLNFRQAIDEMRGKDE